MELPIGVIDSGVGGASILKSVAYLLPDEKFVYLADTKNAPYGEKSNKEIVNLTLNLVDYLVQKRAIKMLIVGCNTSSAIAKKSILETYPALPCVFVEPPIKTAIDGKKKNILLLATKGTLKNNKTVKYYSKWGKKHGIKIDKLFIKDLAFQIDNHPNLIDKILTTKIKNKNYDAVVLGCTHYNFIKENLQRILPKSEIISCEKGVAKRVKTLIYKNAVDSIRFYPRKSFDNVEIILTEFNQSVYLRLKSIFPGCKTAPEK